MTPRPKSLYSDALIPNRGHSSRLPRRIVSESAHEKSNEGLTRRQLLLVGAAGLAMGSGLLLVPKRYFRMPQHAQAFVAKVDDYQSDIADAIIKGMREL